MAIYKEDKNSKEKLIVESELVPMLKDYPKATKHHTQYDLRELSICNGYLYSDTKQVPEIFLKLDFDQALELTKNAIELIRYKYDIKMVRSLPDVKFRIINNKEYACIFTKLYFKEWDNLLNHEPKEYNGGKDMDKFVIAEYIQQLIDQIDYIRLGDKTIVCFAKLNNGYEVVGSSSLGNNEEQTKYFAYKDMVNQIEKLESYKQI